MTEGTSITTQYFYDSIGEITGITSIKDGKKYTTTVDYDMTGRRTSIDNPDSGKIEYTYDAVGNLTTKPALIVMTSQPCSPYQSNQTGFLLLRFVH